MPAERTGPSQSQQMAGTVSSGAASERQLPAKPKWGRVVEVAKGPEAAIRIPESIIRATALTCAAPALKYPATVSVLRCPVMAIVSCGGMFCRPASVTKPDRSECAEKSSPTQASESPGARDRASGGFADELIHAVEQSLAMVPAAMTASATMPTRQRATQA